MSSDNLNLLRLILIPYKPHCRYFQNAFLTARGEFSISESCYIAETGHFNAVEFNICFNQLSYYLIAECSHHQLLNDFSGWDINKFTHN